MKIFELSLDPSYVKDWTAQDGIREILQNSIDQESIDETNKSFVKASNGCLIIENNNSVLKHSTLLLGGGDKANNKQLIGGFGEGYKIALLVLIRLGFKVHIANYGLGELWEPEISHSFAYGTDILKVICKPLKHGVDISKGVSVIVTKQDHNFKEILTEVSLSHRVYKVISNNSVGQLLDSATESGRIYVGGLYITTAKQLFYGYNFKPGMLEIGRDRNITDTFNIKYKAAMNGLFKNIVPEYIDEFLTNLENKIEDLEYIDSYLIPELAKTKIKKKYADKQVISNEADKQTLTDNGIKVSSPIIVHKAVKSIMWQDGYNQSGNKQIKQKSLKDLLGEFLESEKDNLSTEHYNKLNSLLQRK